MNFYIKGVNTRNKGAYWMGQTIFRKILEKYSEASVGVDLSYSGYFELIASPFEVITMKANKDMGKTVWVADKIKKINKRLPINILGTNFMDEDEIDVVFDASGFKYGEVGGLEKLSFLKEKVKKWRKDNKKIIFFPQAFGPFNTQEMQNTMAEVINNSHLIFAREDTSYEHLLQVCGDKEKIKIAPDFSEVRIDEIKQKFEERIVVIPNAKMVKKTKFGSEKYIKFLKTLIKKASDNELSVTILPHSEGDDEQLAVDLEKVSNNVQVKSSGNLEDIQKLINGAKIVFSSRYHGLIAALRLGIPVIGTTWAFKYEELFDEFGLNRYLLKDINPNEAQRAIELLDSPEEQEKLRKKIDGKNSEQKKQTAKMWDLIWAEINTA